MTSEPHETTDPRGSDDAAHDHAGMEVIEFEDCYALMRATSVGRIAFDDGGVPVVLPVNYVIDGRDVLMRTAIGSKLDVAIMRRPVAFEVDEVDEEHGAGWSVLLRGTADTVEEGELIEAARQALPESWAHGVRRTHWIRIRPSEVTGRRVPRRDDT